MKDKWCSINLWCKDNHIQLFWSIAYCLISTLIAFCFQLGDLVSTSYHGYRMWDCLLQGRLGDFYAFSQNGIMEPAVYDPPIYMVFALWTLPVRIVNAVLGHNVQPGILTYWSRLLLGMLFMTAGLQTRRLLELVNDKRASWACPLLLTAPFAYFSIVVLGCYDVFSICLTLLGMEYLLRKKNWCFVLCFMFANLFKYFSLFVFIPLLLLTEKRLWQIFLKTLVGISWVLMNVLFCSQMNATGDRAVLNGKGMTRLFFLEYNVGFPMNGSILLLFLMLICIFAYAYTPQKRERLERWILFLPLAIYSGLLMMMQFHAQWTFLLAPFMVINGILCFQRRRILFLLEAMMFLGFCGICWIACHIDEQLIDICSPLSYVLHLDKLYHVYVYGTERLMSLHPQLPTLCLTIFTGSLLGFNILAMPCITEKDGQDTIFTTSELVWRFMTIFIFIIPTAACFTMSYLSR